MKEINNQNNVSNTNQEESIMITIDDISVNPEDTVASVAEAEIDGYETAVAGDSVCSSYLRKSTRDSHAFAKATIDAHLDKRQVQYQSFVLAGGGQDPVEGWMQSTSFGMNPLTERYYGEAHKDGIIAAFDKGTVRLFNNVMETRPFTREMLLIDSSQLDESVNSEFAESIKKDFLKVKFCPDDNTVYIFVETHAKKLNMTRVFEVHGGFPAEEHLFIDGEDDEELKKLADKEGEVRTYGMIYAGPSNQRRGNYIVFRVHDGEDRAAFMKRMHDDFDFLTGGLLTTLEEFVAAHHAEGKDVGREELFKLNSRISLAFTPTTKSAGFKSFAFFNGKLGSGFGDGMWMLAAELLANYYGLPMESVCGLGLQARVLNGIIGKGMAVVMPEADIMDVLAQYDSKAVSHAEFRKLWIDGKLEDNVLYVVGEGIPQAVFDNNSMKAVTMTPEDDEYFVRIMSVKATTAGKLNIQNAVALQLLDGAPEFIYELGKAHVDKKLADIDRILAGKLKKEIELTEEEQQLFDYLGIDLGVRSVVNPDQYYPQLIADICPAFVAHDTGLFRNIVEQAAKGLVKDITKFNFDIPGGAVRYLQSDLCAYLLGKPVLNEHEVYVCGLPEGAKVDLTRNPKADTKEHYWAVNISLKTIIKRIKAMKGVSEELKAIAIRAFKSLDTSIVVVPATEKVANSLGGADFDGDLVEDNRHPVYVAIQRQEKDGSNDIPKADPSGKTVESFDIEMVQDMFIDGLFGQKMSDGKRMHPTPIGIIANHATLISALLASDDDELEFVLEHTVRPAIRALRVPTNGQPYQRHFTKDDVKIHDEKVVAATVDFYESDTSVESFRNALMDASREGASVEGRCIDQNKTGETVHTGYLGVLECKDINGNSIRVKKGTLRCKAYDTLKMKEHFVTDDDGVRTMTVDYVNVDEERYHYVKSAISFVRDELADYLMERINTYLAMELEPSEVEGKLRTANYGAKKVCHNELFAAKMMHDAILRNSDLVSEDDASLATVEKKAMLDVLANTVRATFDKGTKSAEKFVQIRNMAANTDIDGNVTSYSSFEYVLREEFIQGVIYMANYEGWKVNDTIGYQARVLDGEFVEDGMKVDFVNGMSYAGEHIVTDRKVNGEWTLKQIGSAWYVTKTAAEYFATPDVTKDLMFMTKSFNPSKQVSGNNPMTELTQLRGGKLSFFTKRGMEGGIYATPEGADNGTSWAFYTPWNDKNRQTGEMLKESHTLAWAQNGGTLDVARVFHAPDLSEHAAAGAEFAIVYGRIGKRVKAQRETNTEVRLGARIQ